MNNNDNNSIINTNNNAAMWIPVSTTTHSPNLVVGQDVVPPEVQHDMHLVEQSVFEQQLQHANNGTTMQTRVSEIPPTGVKVNLFILDIFYFCEI